MGSRRSMYSAEVGIASHPAPCFEVYWLMGRRSQRAVYSAEVDNAGHSISRQTGLYSAEVNDTPLS